MSFSINKNLSFIDSFQFLISSLDSLVKNLGKDDFKYLSQEFDNNVLELLKQKGFYPYEYMTDFKKFKEQLPSSLTHVLKVWNNFEMKTIKDYQNFYLKWGVLLSADVFETFRNNSIENYGLYPSHYLSAPVLSWYAMLNRTKVKLELFSYPDMYIFFGKGMRGGVSYISDRYNEANNKYFKSYNPEQESKHIIF